MRARMNGRNMETRRNIQPEDAVTSLLRTAHNALCASWSTQADTWNRIYFSAIELHRVGLLPTADRILDVVRRRITEDTDWLAWLYCKKGEIRYDGGNHEEARRFFNKTLELRPGHLKATIQATPETERLAVVVGERPPFDLPALAVPMDIHAEDSWAYYFSRRKIDILYITPPKNLLRIHPLLFNRIITQHLRDTAEIRCHLSADVSVTIDNATVRRLVRQGTAAQSQTRLSVWQQLVNMAHCAL